MNRYSSKQLLLAISSFLYCFVILLMVPNSLAQSQKPIFPLTSTYTASNPIDQSVIGDFNGDGKPDLAYVTSPGYSSSGIFPYSLNVLLSFGSSSQATVTTPLCMSSTFVFFTTGDVNKDGKLDFVFTCNGYVEVMLGNGDGTFSKPAPYALNSTVAPVLVDLNGDGYLDIAVASGSSNELTVFLNQGNAAGTYGNPQSYPALGTNRIMEAGSGDFNGDGRQDIIASSISASGNGSNSGGFLIFYGNGDGTLQAAQAQSLGSVEINSFATGDFNSDGFTDFAYIPAPVDSSAAPLSPSIQFLLGSTSGTLVSGTTLSLLPIDTYSPTRSSFSTAALTSDGNIDLIVQNVATTIFHGDGKGGFARVASYAAEGAALPADINGDGKVDLVLGTC